MHEASIARQILAMVLQQAEVAGATRVLAIHGRVAEDERLAAASIEVMFRGFARATVAQDATLHMQMRRVPAQCTGCSMVYEPEHHLLLCPACGSSRGTLLEPVGITIETLEVE